MARDRKPTRDPTRLQETDPPDPAEARTPPARPDQRGEGERRADEIAETAERRTTHADDPSRGTSATSPEEIAGAIEPPERS